ncbi:MAG: phosphonate transport system permease protein [Candidatus Aldehydirespiratoraceae bacterium]
MTTTVAPQPLLLPKKPVRRDRRSWAIVVSLVVAWSVLKAGIDPSDVINERGWSQVQKFFAAMVRPDLSRTMLELTIRQAAVTVGYAVVGTALAVIIGLIGGLLLTERVWSPMHGPMAKGRAGWLAGRIAFALPRSMHEVVFGIILVNILGLNPLVAILAIGIPFGAVTAKVFAELIDEAPRDAELILRAAGAGRLTAVLFATVPTVLSDLVSYAFYRFECSLRSAAVLGIVGAGGLGFQLALSFQSLRYNEMWTLLWALVILSGIADRWSSLVRRRRNPAAIEMHAAIEAPAAIHRGVQSKPERDGFLRASAIIYTLAVPVAIWRLDLDFSTLWAPRARSLAAELGRDAWPPQIGVGGFGGLVDDSLDTIALAVLAIALAWLVASPIAFLARRPSSKVGGLRAVIRRLASALVRFVLLVSRSVPPPVWAFIVVFVLFPGLWPGVVALAIYNVGVLGRLQADVVENGDQRPTEVLAAMGASAPGALTVATIPAVAGRFTALGLYRWEVAIRETVIVGVVGAAGLGRRLDEQTSSFDYDGILATILALFVVTIAVDVASASIRRSIR